MGKTDVNVMTGTKVPALRFNGFDDEWVEKKLGDVLTSYPSRKHISDLNCDDDVMYLEIQQGDSPKAGYSKGVPFEEFSEVILFGDHTLSLYSPEEPFVLSTDGLKILGSNSLDIDFLYEIININKPDSEGYKRHFSILRNRRVKYPTRPSEQQQIGQTFKTVDALIQSEEQKLEQLQSLKKSLLQKMFPKKGVTVPELRFDGFSGDWTEKKLGDVFKRVSVKGRTDLPFITVTETETNVREDSHQGYGNDVSDTAKAKAKVILDGQFLIDLTSYSRGLYLCRMDGLTSNAYNVLDMSVGNEKFWSEYFITHNFVQSLKSITPPGARQGKMVEVDSLLKFDTMVPEHDEQVAIGQFFKSFDGLIAKQEEKVENGKLLKKALLQKMFV